MEEQEEQEARTTENKHEAKLGSSCETESLKNRTEETKEITENLSPDHQFSEVFDLKQYLELKKMEKEEKLGSLPPEIQPIAVLKNSCVKPIDSTVVQMLPSQMIFGKTTL